MCRGDDNNMTDMKKTLFVNGKIILRDGILEGGRLLVIGDRIRGIWSCGEAEGRVGR